MLINLDLCLGGILFPANRSFAHNCNFLIFWPYHQHSITPGNFHSILWHFSSKIPEACTCISEVHVKKHSFLKSTQQHGLREEANLIPKAKDPQIQRGECIYQLSVYFLYMPLHISSAQTRRRNPGDLYLVKKMLTQTRT